MPAWRGGETEKKKLFHSLLNCCPVVITDKEIREPLTAPDAENSSALQIGMSACRAMLSDLRGMGISSPIISES